MTDISGLRVLVVEDEQNHAQVLAELLERSGHRVSIAPSLPHAEGRLKDGAFDLIITDLILGARRGTELLDLARDLPDPPEVMVISGAGSIEDAVEAMQMGASHYFTKPLDVKDIRSVVGKAKDRILRRRGGQGDDPEGFLGIVGKSAPMVRVFDTIRRIAPSTATVLIQGENGTGKELVAKAIHSLSPRKDRPFVALNCAALSEGLLESELFGHERGAFTGAASSREGKFEYAHGGTLFLDEVGDMPLSLQVKLLRVIQEREVVRLGSNKTIAVDVRLVCATNKDLGKEIQEGRFREDLYYRIKVISITLPPLSAREGDIPLLVDSFLREFTRVHRRSIRGMDPEVLAILEAQPWPGNVRQLRNVVETMVLLAEGDVITRRDLPPELDTSSPAPSPGTALVAVEDLGRYTLDQWEKQLIQLQLDRHEGNRAKVAKALGISERTLYRKLKEYGLSGA